MNYIAMALKKKIDALEERNSISLFQCEDYNFADEEDKRVRTEYLYMSRLFHLERLKKRVKNLSGEEKIDGKPGHCGGGIGSSSGKKKRRRPANEEKVEANKQQKITGNNVLDVFSSAAEKVAVDALVRKGGLEGAIGSHIKNRGADLRSPLAIFDWNRLL
ncbi:hypothetical protein FGB62_108g111 [Gracilaria domingensis]|nr:hypothetical protein FGB62_108g111 [Gracilaria domingensis]